MPQPASQRSSTDAAPITGAGPVMPFIAADVGGTHARVALVSAAAADRPVNVIAYRKYVCAEHADLGAVLADFIAGLPGERPRDAVVACAGYVIDGAVVHANLPWPVRLDAVRRAAGLERLEVVNDFEAVAHATCQIDPAQTEALHAPDVAVDANRPVLVLGPGTGLGAAVVLQVGGRRTVIGTEAGQAGFAPGSGLELEVLRILRLRQPHVSVENLLSGPGLVNIHAAVCSLAGVSPRLSQPSQITAAAMSGTDPQALQALRVFCAALGGAVGDLVLATGATGGVYLAGGILPQIRAFLRESEFVARFLDKGPMRGQLERVPVRLIEHGQLGIVGAARWLLERQGRGVGKAPS